MALSGQVRTRATTGTTGIAGSGLSDAAALRGQMGKGGRGGGGVKVTSRTEGWEGRVRSGCTLPHLRGDLGTPVLGWEWVPNTLRGVTLRASLCSRRRLSSDPGAPSCVRSSRSSSAAQHRDALTFPVRAAGGKSGEAVPSVPRPDSHVTNPVLEAGTTPGPSPGGRSARDPAAGRLATSLPAAPAGSRGSGPGPAALRVRLRGPVPPPAAFPTLRGGRFPGDSRPEAHRRRGGCAPGSARGGRADGSSGAGLGAARGQGRAGAGRAGGCGGRPAGAPPRPV